VATLKYEKLTQSQKIQYLNLINQPLGVEKADKRWGRATSLGHRGATMRFWNQLLGVYHAHSYDSDNQSELRVLAFLINAAVAHGCNKVDGRTFPNLGRFKRHILSPLKSGKVEVSALRVLYSANR